MTKAMGALRRWGWFVALCVVIGAVAGWAAGVVAPARVPSYDATSVVLFDLSRASAISAPKAAQQAGLRISRGEVPLKAAAALGMKDPKVLIDGLDVSVNDASLSITIVAHDDVAAKARAKVEAVTTAFLEVSNQEELDALDARIKLVEGQVGAAQTRLTTFDQQNPGIAVLTDMANPLVRQRSDLLTAIADLSRQLDQDRELRTTTSGPYTALGHPTVSEADTSVLELPQSAAARVALLAAFGALLGVAIVAVIERLNPRLDTSDEVKAALQLPILTNVPSLRRGNFRRVEHVDTAHFIGAYAEAYRRLRSALQFVMSQNGTEKSPRSFLVVSASPSEGKTSTVSCLAFALSEASVPTLALNGDTRRPTLHDRLGVNASPGLEDLAEVSMARRSVDDIVQQASHADLWVVASGRPSPLTPDLVEAARQVIDTTVARGGTVVVDSAPLLATSDAVDLLPLVDRVLFVVRCGHTTRREALAAVEVLQQRNAHILGCVCIEAAEAGGGLRYYDDYYMSVPTAPTQAAAPVQAAPVQVAAPTPASAPATPLSAPMPAHGPTPVSAQAPAPPPVPQAPAPKRPATSAWASPLTPLPNLPPSSAVPFDAQRSP